MRKTSGGYPRSMQTTVRIVSLGVCTNTRRFYQRICAPLEPSYLASPALYLVYNHIGEKAKYF